MSNNVQPFTYKDHAVRVLADLCKVLDLAKSSCVAMRMADDMRGAH